MYKANILDFAKKQIIEKAVREIDSSDIKRERVYADLSKWFGEQDTIEFDDSAETFISLKENGNFLDGFKGLKLKVIRDGKEVDIKKEPYHCTLIINKCLMSFFTFGD